VRLATNFADMAAALASEPAKEHVSEILAMQPQLIARMQQIEAELASFRQDMTPVRKTPTVVEVQGKLENLEAQMAHYQSEFQKLEKQLAVAHSIEMSASVETERLLQAQQEEHAQALLSQQAQAATEAERRHAELQAAQAAQQAQQVELAKGLHEQQAAMAAAHEERQKQMDAEFAKQQNAQITRISRSEKAAAEAAHAENMAAEKAAMQAAMDAKQAETEKLLQAQQEEHAQTLASQQAQQAQAAAEAERRSAELQAAQAAQQAEMEKHAAAQREAAEQQAVAVQLMPKFAVAPATPSDDLPANALNVVQRKLQDLEVQMTHYQSEFQLLQKQLAVLQSIDMSASVETERLLQAQQEEHAQTLASQQAQQAQAAAEAERRSAELKKMQAQQAELAMVHEQQFGEQTAMRAAMGVGPVDSSALLSQMQEKLLGLESQIAHFQLEAQQLQQLALLDRVAALESRAQNVPLKLQHAVAQVQMQQDQLLVPLVGKLADAEQTLSANIESLEKEMAELQNSTASTQVSSIQGAHDAVRHLQGRVDAHDAQLSACVAQAGHLQDELSNQQESQEQLAQKVDGTSATVTEALQASHAKQAELEGLIKIQQEAHAQALAELTVDDGRVDDGEKMRHSEMLARVQQQAETAEAGVHDLREALAHQQEVAALHGSQLTTLSPDLYELRGRCTEQLEHRQLEHKAVREQLVALEKAFKEAQMRHEAQLEQHEAALAAQSAATIALPEAVPPQRSTAPPPHVAEMQQQLQDVLSEVEEQKGLLEQLEKGLGNRLDDVEKAKMPTTGAPPIEAVAQLQQQQDQLLIPLVGKLADAEQTSAGQVEALWTDIQGQKKQRGEEMQLVNDAVQELDELLQAHLLEFRNRLNGAHLTLFPCCDFSATQSHSGRPRSDRSSTRHDDA
jgi:hypothetical protein